MDAKPQLWVIYIDTYSRLRLSFLTVKIPLEADHVMAFVYCPRSEKQDVSHADLLFSTGFVTEVIVCLRILYYIIACYSILRCTVNPLWYVLVDDHTSSRQDSPLQDMRAERRLDA